MKGTQTELNLLKAFAGESQARNRYLFYAKIAKKEGYEQIGRIFEQVADHELSHAKNFFKYLENEGDLEVIAHFPGGKLGSTLENLKRAANGEGEEWQVLYPEYAEVAQQEGFPKVAALFKNIAKVEAGHEARFLRIIQRLEAGTWFKREEDVVWMCLKCGYLHEGMTPPEVCPACFHPMAYFEVHMEQF